MSSILDTVRTRQLIQQKFRTQSAFADACGVTRQYISEVLSGKQVPALERMIQFAELLEVPIDDLLAKKV